MRDIRIVFEVEETPLLHDMQLNRPMLDTIGMILTTLRNSEMRIFLVSAGAIAAGIDLLKLKEYPQLLIEKQALSAIGQVKLIKKYQNVFDEYNQVVAQVLLDRNILQSPTRAQNAKNTFEKLLKMNVIPIINENDPVSTQDIEQEDNYPLTESVATIVNANAIVSIEADGTFKAVERNAKKVTQLKTKEDLFEYLADVSRRHKKHERLRIFPKTYDEFEQMPVEVWE